MELLKMTNITKSFSGGGSCFRTFDFPWERGEVHALLGENAPVSPH